MSNSIYGRFALKYDGSKCSIVTNSEAREIELKYRTLESKELSTNKGLEYIKYIPLPSSTTFELDKELYFNEFLTGQNRLIGNDISRSVQISIFTTSYAAIFMHKFLTLPNNPCLYTDTDSVILKHPLESEFVGDKLGQFKFLGKVKKGYFIAPKLYCLVMYNGDIIIKSKGVDSKSLNLEDFINLSKGSELTAQKTQFKTSWNDINVSYNKQDITVRPLIKKRDLVYASPTSKETKPVKVINNVIIRSQPMTMSITKYVRMTMGITKYVPMTMSITKYEPK